MEKGVKTVTEGHPLTVTKKWSIGLDVWINLLSVSENDEDDLLGSEYIENNIYFRITTTDNVIVWFNTEVFDGELTIEYCTPFSEN